jgi:hypothetical protein
MPAQELRISPRLDRQFRVEYSILSGLGMLSVLDASTLDFSLSGARIETANVLKPGDQLSVRIEVPDLRAYVMGESGKRSFKTTVVMCFGEVRWVKPSEEEGCFSAGIQFEKMSVVERFYLKRLLEVEVYQDML